MTRLQFEAASAKKPLINFCGSELVDDDADSAVIGNIVMKLKDQLAVKEEMLNEAVIDYHNKTEEMNKVQQENEILNKECIKAAAVIAELQVKSEMFYFSFKHYINCWALHFFRLSWRKATCC